jgi:hypothetical protein
MGWIQPTGHSWPPLSYMLVLKEIKSSAAMTDSFYLGENLLFMNVVTAKFLLRNN